MSKQPISFEVYTILRKQGHTNIDMEARYFLLDGDDATEKSTTTDEEREANTSATVTALAKKNTAYKSSNSHPKTDRRLMNRTRLPTDMLKISHFWKSSLLRVDASTQQFFAELQPWLENKGGIAQSQQFRLDLSHGATSLSLDGPSVSQLVGKLLHAGVLVNDGPGRFTRANPAPVMEEDKTKSV